jgi:DNA-binding MurR/RpiR family transcriptional regulator
MSNYKQKVTNHFEGLSPTMKKVGKYLVDHPNKFAMLPAGKIGEELGVSETTIIRFCYALQYEGYTELQKEVRNTLINNQSSLIKYQNDKQEIAKEPNFYSKAIIQDQINIQKMLEELNECELQSVVDRLISSKEVYVSGVRTSFSIAHWFSFTLNLIQGNAKLFQSSIDDIPLLLSNISETSTFVAISFHRYAKETIQLAHAVKSKGGFVIGITDSPLAPIGKYSDILLPVSLSVKSTIDAGPAIFSLMNAIVAGVSIHNNKVFENQRERYESLYLEDLFHS